MMTFSRTRVGLAVVMSLLMACAGNPRNQDTAQAPRSDDLLELLTGFGESLSKRNFARAVDYMVPEEKALMMEGGTVPPDKQKMLLALPLQKLIRHPGIRVENGHIAGIYAVLPNLKQGDAAANIASAGDESNSSEAAGLNGEPAAEPKGPMAAAGETTMGDFDDNATVSASNPNDPQLKAAVNKFFTAVNRKNWSTALAMMNENERRFLLDEKGRLKESSKQRLAQMDQKNREALTLQDGKITGVTLLLPTND